MSMQSHQVDASIGIVFRIEEHGILTECPADDNCCDDTAQQQEVDQSVNANRILLCYRVIRHDIGQNWFFAVIVGVNDIINRQHHSSAKYKRPEQFQRPKERDSVQETKKQRRIAQRRQRTADIADQENEKDDGMRFGFTKLIGPDDRPDQKHRGAGGTDPAGQQCSDQDHSDIKYGRSLEGAADDYAAGNDKQTAKQNDKRDIVNNINVQRIVHRGRNVKQHGKGDEKRHCPEQTDFCHIMFPPVSIDQRPKRNGEQDADKGQSHPHR